MDCALREGVLWVRIVGAPVLSEFLRLMRGVADDPSIPPGVPIVIDVRRAAGGPSLQEMEEVSDFFVEHASAFGPKALLVGSVLQYGLARVGKALDQVRGMELQIFRDENAALQALQPRAGAD